MLRSAHQKSRFISCPSTHIRLASASTTPWQTVGRVTKKSQPPKTFPPIVTSGKQKHAASTNDSSDPPRKRLLSPYTLSSRLRDLCDQDDFDEAVEMLKNAPLDAQNIKVWNAMITSAFLAQKYKLGWQLFVDVRLFPPYISALSKCFAESCIMCSANDGASFPISGHISP